MLTAVPVLCMELSASMTPNSSHHPEFCCPPLSFSGFCGFRGYVGGSRMEDHSSTKDFWDKDLGADHFFRTVKLGVRQEKMKGQWEGIYWSCCWASGIWSHWESCTVSPRIICLKESSWVLSTCFRLSGVRVVLGALTNPTQMCAHYTHTCSYAHTCIWDAPIPLKLGRAVLHSSSWNQTWAFMNSFMFLGMPWALFRGKMSLLKSHIWLLKTPWEVEMWLFQHFLHAKTLIPWMHF